jgi:hypothetical protein
MVSGVLVRLHLLRTACAGLAAFMLAAAAAGAEPARPPAPDTGPAPAPPSATAPPAGAPGTPGDQPIRLRSTFETQQATATFTVPAEWAVRMRAAGVTLTAPSSRKGCSHILDVRLGAIYVAPITTSVGWVASRLSDKGQLVSMHPGELSWGAAVSRKDRASDGAAARVTAKGRYGPIMSEVLMHADLSRSCPANQAPKAARRIARLLSGVGITASRR